MQQTEVLLTIKLNQQLFVDPKRILLLQEIAKTGSMNQAAKNARVSYKSAWDHLHAMELISPKPLLEKNTGGKNGGGTVLTNYSKRLLQLYELLAITQEKAFTILQDESIPLDSVLSATAKFSPQSSARNQFLGQVSKIVEQDNRYYIHLKIEDFPIELTACITHKSVERLRLEVSKEVILMVKAPWLNVHLTPVALENCFPAVVKQISEEHEVTLLAGEKLCYATLSPDIRLNEGQSVWVTIDPEQIVLMTL